MYPCHPYIESRLTLYLEREKHQQSRSSGAAAPEVAARRASRTLQSTRVSSGLQRLLNVHGESDLFRCE